MLIIDASSGIPLGISPVGLAVLQPASNRLIIFLEGGEGGGTVCEERPRKIALWTLCEQKSTEISESNTSVSLLELGGVRQNIRTMGQLKSDQQSKKYHRRSSEVSPSRS